MKRKLPPAKAPLPKFRSDEEAAEYLQTHSVAEVWNQLPEGRSSEAVETSGKGNSAMLCSDKGPDFDSIGSRTDCCGQEDRGC
jgi:hypothetical protein